ncbi:hypothetical protein ACHAXR_000317, partial [Thalassiosira sp. AJA248-18]
MTGSASGMAEVTQKHGFASATILITLSEVNSGGKSKREAERLIFWILPSQSMSSTKTRLVDTYQKTTTLYLYIPQASAHPKGVIKGMILGELRRYKKQNSKREDYLKMVRLLFVRLKARGWRPSLLKDLFMEGANRVESE